MIEQLYRRAVKMCGEVEVYLEETQSSSCFSEDGKIDRLSRESEIGYGVRAVANQRVGFASGNDLNSFDKVVRKALASAKFGNKFFGFPAKAKYTPVGGIFSKAVASLEDDVLKDKVAMMIKIVKRAGARPTHASAGRSVARFAVANSNGVLAEESGTSLGCGVEAMAGNSRASDDDETVDESADFEGVALATAKLAIACRRKKAPPKGRLKVLLKPRAAEELLSSSLLPAFDGESVWRKTSFLSGRVGEEIFPHDISIIDSGVVANATGSARCDREGVPCRETWLVRKGQITGFLHNQESAAKSGCASTGNGMRSYNGTPSISSTNIIFSKGRRSEADLLASAGRCLVVADISGAHTVNSFSGDFSVEAQNSFLAEGGKAARAVGACMLSGNIFAALKEAEFSREQRIIDAVTIGSLMLEIDVSA